MTDAVVASATHGVRSEVVELTKQTKELKEEIRGLRTENASLGGKMLWLTRVMAVATVVGIILTATMALNAIGWIG